MQAIQERHECGKLSRLVAAQCSQMYHYDYKVLGLFKLHGSTIV